MKSFRDQFSTGYRDGNGDLSLRPAEVSITVAILSAGTFGGALISAPFGDWIGRRLSIIASIALFILGVIFQVTAHALPLLLAGRLIAGLGVGSVSVLVPLYQSEMAPKWIRGTLVCAYQFSITVGLLSASIINQLTYRIPSSAAYRIPFSLQLIWAVILCLGLLILPETPRYLIKRGDKRAAGLALSRLRRLDITHPALQEELAEIEANHEYELALGTASYKDVFTGSPHLGRRILTGCGLQMLQQLTGINFIMYYGTTFFEGAGVVNPFTISLVLNIINVVSTVPGLFVVETWGRRKLLIVGSIGMAISQLVIAAFSTATDDMSGLVAKILIVFLSFFVFFYAASWGPVTWVVTSEIYPLKVRAKSMSISTASNWLLNFGIAYGTPFLVQQGTGYASLGPKVFFLWGAFCILGAIFVYCMVYETSKISLEQIDEMYERVHLAWKSKGFEPSWSFQQLRDEGFAESGVPPPPPQELEPPRTGSTATDMSIQTIQTTEMHVEHSESDEDKAVRELGLSNVDFSY
ncbi:general substrate transporter [Astrocystis sublimbata]|nr:general substrate transporter [Astrocystis sublimbata]